MIVTHCTIAIIENDRRLASRLHDRLGSAGFQSQVFQSIDQFSRSQSPGEIVLLSSEVADFRTESLAEASADFQKPVILFVAQGQISVAVQAIEQGALTALEKPISEDQMLAAIKRGIEVRGRQMTIARRRRQLVEGICSLTRREREVFGLLLTGMHVKKVGQTLGIDQKTVHTFRSNVMRKLRLDSNAEMVRAIALAFGRYGLETADAIVKARSSGEVCKWAEAASRSWREH